MFKSQAGQDKWVCEELNFKKNGFFVEIGAYDGIESSNTFYLEKFLQWNGISIEPNLKAFNALCINRKSININCAILSYNGNCNFNKDRVIIGLGDTPCNTLENILIKNKAPKNIDYISLDVEGSEYEILSCFPFENWNINLWTIEHNLYLNGSINKNNIYEIMSKNGYERIKEDVLADGKFPFEDWYKKII